MVRPSTSQSSPALVGRPSKSNNYWGFCKGSWTMREDWRKGLQTQVVQSGMFAQESVWRCKHCYFTGRIFGKQKPFVIDPNVHEDEGTGLRYKWVFLAKCHTKVKMVAKEGEGGFGCLFCSLSNIHTSVFGSQDLMFKHIMDEHASAISDDLANRAKCIVGRRAEAKEDWDINIV